MAFSIKNFFSKEASGEGNVPNRELFNFATGLTGQNIAYSFQSGWLNYFCVNLLHIDSRKVGSIFFASQFWDAVNDPVIGSFIDRHRFKSGEKLRPFLLYTPPIIGALTALMFLQVPFNSTGRLFYILLLYLIWDFIYSVEDVALWGLVAVASPNSDERGRVAQWVSIGAGAGGTIAGAFSFIRDMLLGAGLEDRYIFMIFAVLFGLGGQLLAMRAHKVKERVRSAPAKKGEESLRETLSMLFKNKKLLIISIARFLGNTFPKVGAIYFFENCMSLKIGSIEIGGGMMNTVFPLLAGIPGAAAIFFANKIAIRIGGMKRLLIVAKVMETACRVLSFIIGLNGGYNTPWKLVLILLLHAAMNIPCSMMDIGHRALTSDGIDELELKTGKRSEGVAFSTQNFVSKMNNGVTSLIEGFVLSALGYDSKLKDAGKPQSAKFLKWQWPLYVLSPAIGSLLYVIAISFLKDDRNMQAEISRQLIARREAQAESEPVAVTSGE